MEVEIVLLAVFSILFILSLLVYNFGDKVSLKKKDKKAKPEKKDSKVVKTEKEKPEKKAVEPKKIKPVTMKTTRPVLLSPAPMEPKKLEAPKTEQVKPAASRPKTIDQTEIDEIRKFIESKPETTGTRQGLSDYNKVQTFGDVIDIDDSYPNFVTDYDPYVNRPQRTGESDFMKNRGDDKKLYEELKNMSPEMKKIIMADILRRKH